MPFCFHKCHYCDFFSIVDAPAPLPASQTPHAAAPAPGVHAPRRQQPFVERLLAELRLRATQAQLLPVAIFVGGGTPTLLDPALWRLWLAAMRDMGLMRHVREFTVEANPETVTPALMKELVEGGVNRISIGAQSFHPALLKTLERWHDPASVAAAVATIRAAGIDNINLDLIFAIPGQTMAMLDADLDAALSLNPTHLSCYSLIYEPNTAMAQRLKMGQVTPADEEMERAMYARVIERLEAAGFEHYEVSNWAKKEGKEECKKEGSEALRHEGMAAGDQVAAASGSRLRCQHNLIYWLNGNWLGLGPAAASHVDGHRWKNVPNLGRYLASDGEPPTMDHEHLPAGQSIGEQLMLRLRLREGAPLAWLKENLPADDGRHRAFEELIAIGMLERTATNLRLTREGLFIADAVLAKLL